MVERTLAEIHEEGPMTGCGYFEITKSSLTSMASISITYVIILMQFKSAQNTTCLQNKQNIEDNSILLQSECGTQIYNWFMLN